MRILHLTDLHVGMASQEWLWPTAKRALFEDLTRLHDKVGGLDLVIFSGDLTQKAGSSEYTKLNEVLAELWGLLKSLGSTPRLFPVPGNHDLVRPNSVAPAAMMLERWWESPDVRQAFWKNEPEDYRKLIDTVFAPYKEWLDGLSEGPVPLVQLTHGVIPGDVAAEIEVSGQSLGLVGLNSAWLQLGDGDYRHKLDVDPRQLMALTDCDPDVWCAKHDFNLLITHHPQDWLHPRSHEAWRSEVHTPSRFDGHLFGHMHEGSTVYLSEGGVHGRRYIQGASLFGLEKRSGGIDRVHGYSILELKQFESGQRQLRQWPRRAHKGHSAVWKLIPDPDFDCNDSGYVEHRYGVEKDSATHCDAYTSNVEGATLSLASGRSITALRKRLPEVSAFKDVRGVEKGMGEKVLSSRRALWLVADWGVGDEQFVRALQLNQAVEQSFIYKLDCQNCFTRQDIYTAVQEQAGCSFEQLCEQLSLEGPCFLVLDDVPILEGSDKVAHGLQNEVEFIADILLQYCQDVRLIVKSRRSPQHAALQVVELRPFDEADTMAYVVSHEQGGRNLASHRFVRQLYRHTDGIPTRIDRAIRDVQIVGVTQLHTLDSDVAGKSAAMSAAPVGLVETLRELEQSKDPTAGRALKLLKVLTMFPRGEKLETVKRFYGTSQFYAQDARILIDALLVNSVEIPSIAAEHEDSAKALVVWRPVREFWYASLPAAELKNLNQQSLTLYFGRDWASKGIRTPKHMRFSDPRCGAWQIGNASMLVLREVRAAVESKAAPRCAAARDLASAYCTSLTSGQHFLAVNSLCEDLIPLFEELSRPPDINILRSEFAKSLRITGQSERAIELCKQIQESSPSKILLQPTYLTLAMSYQAIKRFDEAVLSAESCIQLDPRSNLSFQARSIAVGLKREDPDREKKLRLIEVQARKKKAFVAANNISITLAEECSDPTSQRKLYEEIFDRSITDGDYNNTLRSTIRLAKIQLDEARGLSGKLLTRLIDAYHYLYGEDRQGLFRQCHAALWEAFESRHEVENLLRLFRYSSLRWRTRGMHATETEFIGRLSLLLGDRANGDFGRSNRELAYFLARTGQAICSKNG